MATEGNPWWLLRLEQAQAQLQGENYVRWLKEQAPELGIPAEVIAAQLHRVGAEEAQEQRLQTIEAKVQQEAETVAKPLAKPAQRGTKLNKK
jgi:hypothetical protein